MAQDHYKTLQVSRHAEPEVIEKAYKALAMKHHPDRAAPERKDEATRRLQRINEAYAVLSDPSKRRRYDETLPAEGDGGWERFLDAGLWGLFKDWVERRG
jgi:DnaJ-class molecular chaperone